MKTCCRSLLTILLVTFSVLAVPRAQTAGVTNVFDENSGANAYEGFASTNWTGGAFAGLTPNAGTEFFASANGNTDIDFPGLQFTKVLGGTIDNRTYDVSFFIAKYSFPEQGPPFDHMNGVTFSDFTSLSIGGTGGTTRWISTPDPIADAVWVQWTGKYTPSAADVGTPFQFSATLRLDAMHALAIDGPVIAAPEQPATGTSIITTVAGGGPNNVPALEANVHQPRAVTLDSAGNLYIAAAALARVLKVDSSGNLTTVAGNGFFAFGGDGGPAIQAGISQPWGVAVDNGGNIYISDSNHRIRKVDVRSGVITTIAGNGTSGFSGDGGPATAASVNSPKGLALDAAGHLYFADFGNDRIRRVDLASGVITTVAGSGVRGFAGDGGPATSADLNRPIGVAVDAFGNLYIADVLNNRIRKVDGTNGVMTTVAGNGTASFSGDGGSATSAGVNTPNGVTVDSAGNIYIGESGRVRRVDAAGGVINSVAANLNGPEGLGIDATGNVYIACWGEHRVRRIDAVSGELTIAAGNGKLQTSGDGGRATDASIDAQAVAVDGAGNLYVAQRLDPSIRKVTAATGIISTVAGDQTAGFSGDGGLATAAQMTDAMGVAVDASSNIYIADTFNYRIRKVHATTGLISTVAGSSQGFGGDGGAATLARLNGPRDVALNAAGDIYIADTDNFRVRKVTASTGIITTVAGDGTPTFSGDGGPANLAGVGVPWGIALDANGSLYIADLANNRVRRVDAATGIIATIAGNGSAAFSGDGGPATAAGLNPAGVAVEADGTIYIADVGNHRIRAIDSAGTITTVAGNGIPAFAGDGGLATDASIVNPFRIAVTSDGALYIADSGSARIRRVAAGVDLAIVKTAAPDPGTAGQLLTYTLMVTNNGPQTATGVTMTDMLPAGVTGISSTATQGSCAAGSPVTCALGTIASGSSAAVVITLTPVEGGVITNVATVTGDQVDLNPANNTATALTTVIGVADLALIKADSPDPVPAGQPLTYTLAVTNSGPSSTTGVSVVDALPAGVALVSSTPSQGNCTGTGTLSCALGTLPANGGATVVITVIPTAAGTLSNAATVSGVESDPTSANNSATATTTVTPAADLRVTATTAPSTAAIGERLTYTLTAINHGPSPATSVAFVDTLPAGVTLLSASATQGTCGAFAGRVGCAIGAVASGASVTITIAVRPVILGTTTLTNTATVRSTVQDLALENNTVTTVTEVLAVSTTVIYGIKSRAPSTGDSSAPTLLYKFSPTGSGLVEIGEVRVGTTSLDVDGLAASPRLGLFAFALGGGSRLLRVNPATGAATTVGPLFPGRVVRGATFDASDRLWVLDDATDRIIQIDPATGAIIGTPVRVRNASGAFIDVSSICDIAQRADGQFFFTRSAGIARLDIATGVVGPGFVDFVNGPDGSALRFAGAAFSTRPEIDTNHLFTFDINGADDIWRYDVTLGATSRQLMYGTILGLVNAGRGDLTAAR